MTPRRQGRNERVKGKAASGSAEENLGEAVRRLRTERHLSVRTLAGRSGFSPSFISQVELNQASPSIASLQRLAGALGVTLGEFFREPHAPATAVTRATRRRRLTSWWSRARLEALSPMSTGRRFEAVMITIAPGGASGKKPYGQAGEDFAFVVEGDVRLTLGVTVHRLAVGDAVTFNAATPHLWQNAGKRRTRLVIVSSRLTA
jgi:transcriptional regulator with XRE-family HTH domain